MSDLKLQIFISYSHQNREACGSIASLFGEERFSVWYDKGLNPGDVYRKRIAQVIAGADCFLVLISPSSVCSEWVLDELEYAKKLHKRILPIWVEETELPQDLDMILQRYHSLFWHLRESDEQFRRSLLRVFDSGEEEDGQALLGYGNEFSEQENLRMKDLLEQERHGAFSLCYRPENAVLLGMAHLFGGICPIDRKKAAFYFRVAQYGGSLDGSYFLLHLQLEERRIATWDEPDEEFSRPIVEQIRQLAQQGSLHARLCMGNLYWYGKFGCPADPKKSAEYYEGCAREGNARAQYLMAANYYYGDGVEQDYVLARMYANLALEQKYLKSWRRLGKFYRDGKALPQDYQKARECYEKGAKMGDYNCFNKVGDMLYYGWGFPVDYEQAVACYRQAEQAPSGGQRYCLQKAKYALGRCYELGHGLPQDRKKAAEYYLEGYRYGSQDCREAFLRLSRQP